MLYLWTYFRNHQAFCSTGWWGGNSWKWPICHQRWSEGFCLGTRAVGSAVPWPTPLCFSCGLPLSRRVGVFYVTHQELAHLSCQVHVHSGEEVESCQCMGHFCLLLSPPSFAPSVFRELVLEPLVLADAIVGVPVPWCCGIYSLLIGICWRLSSLLYSLTSFSNWLSGVSKSC